MNKKEIKQLEKVVADVIGVPSVQFIKPEHVVEPSVDMKLLEMENKLNMLRHNQMTLRQAKEEKKTRRAVKIDSLINKAVEIMDNPEQLIRKSKIAYSVLNYFFPIEENLAEEKLEYVIQGHYDHHKVDAVEEGNIVYLNRDFKGLK
ncbi:hypothetical protein [Cytobacillus oceanisediminis]|uniref:hypothetical protein n=1 Tax=Cytobacillus oceanisediminis TaxID=665099 RepID=UPI001FB1F640|nr:hypothetical protein [Cytobacillus oceanisediminis]UOE58103.1 hypothetical protein IRB79_26700 [Cytobacillus oceanisediminis]